MPTSPIRLPALLLLGPTGSGKTPLGDRLVQRGLWGHRCVHFDFGANLRAVVDRNEPDEFIGRRDVDFLRGVLETGALLEDEDFPLAAKILRSFLAAHHTMPDTWLVLNGLPRHAGQARAMEELVDVRAVAQLQCAGEVVLSRIDSNVGGDRIGRGDDSLEAVEQKLIVYRARTEPLVDYYRSKGAPIISLAVTPHTTADDAWQTLHAHSEPSH